MNKLWSNQVKQKGYYTRKSMPNLNVQNVIVYFMNQLLIISYSVSITVDNSTLPAAGENPKDKN